MEQQPDREARIGVLASFWASWPFMLVALVSFYFQKSAPDLTAGIRDNIASTPR